MDSKNHQTQFSAEDITLLARCMWLEARKDGLSGMYAVAHCVKNRIKSENFPATLHNIIMQKNAFSWTREDDPQFNLNPEDVHPANLWSEAQRLAAAVLNTDDADPTLGAHYYRNEKTATSGWFQRVIANDPVNHPMTTKIGNHTFYI